MGKILDEIQKAMIAFKLHTLREMCGQLTDKQMELFNRAFPYGGDDWPESKLNTAIDLVERTIEGNMKKQEKT